MAIRPETPGDQDGIRAVHTLAFGRPDEAALVDRLRASASPLISLVASDDTGGIVGHILFSPVTLEPSAPDPPLLLGLAPMGVAPSQQRRGIGSSLVHAGLDASDRLGAAGVVVLGHPDYYPRFGFVPASRFGLRCRYDVPDEAFMAIERRPRAFGIGPATIAYHPAFDGL